MFVTYEFMCFFLALLVVYYSIPKKFQWILLLFFNFIFYFSAGVIYPVFLLITSITIYLAGIRLEKLDCGLEEYTQRIKTENITDELKYERKKFKKKISRKKKRVMIACLLLNIGILAVIKYTNFAIGNFNTLLEAAGKNALPYVNLIVPMGISFYTFQAVGYLLDVYWNRCKPQKNFFRFTLFVSFFPQLVQGPISRYGNLSETLYQEHAFDWRQICFGLERVLWGYFKKLVVADRISIAVNALMEEPNTYTGGYVFISMLFYAVYLYADFTGGIDITIGIAQTLGIKLEENFIRPFFSKSIAEYWRRWHISMGTWFRDYVFYPCSLSRALKSITRFCKKHFGAGIAKRVPVYIATLLVWTLTGIWHGAAWNFVAWGFTNGCVILISQECEPLYKRFHEKFPRLTVTAGYRAFQVVRTFLLMCCLRLYDRYDSVQTVFRQFVYMFTKFGSCKVTLSELLSLGLNVSDYAVVLLGVGVMFCVSMASRTGSVREKIAQKPYFVRYALYTMLFFSVLLLGCYGVGYDSQQFIYNQF